MTQQEQILKTGSDGAYGSTMEALRRAEASLPDLTTSYDGEIRSLYEKIVNRPAFRYEAESDPLYGMYRDRYVREGSLAIIIGTAEKWRKKEISDPMPQCFPTP